MRGVNLVTETGNFYWHFHPVGTGLVYTYHKKSMQVIVCNSATGEMVDLKDFYHTGGFEAKEDFKQYVMEIYVHMASVKGITLEEKYFDEKIFSGEISVGIDFKLLSN